MRPYFFAGCLSVRVRGRGGGGGALGVARTVWVGKSGLWTGFLGPPIHPVCETAVAIQREQTSVCNCVQTAQPEMGQRGRGGGNLKPS